MPVEPPRSAAFPLQSALRILLDLLLLCFALNLVLQPLVEPDFGWHLRAGLDWLSHGLRLPDTDPYSHTMPDWRWVEHAWLTDGIVALLYRTFGAFGGLVVILWFGLVTLLAWWAAAAAAAVSRTYRLIAMVAGLWVALPFLGARTQLVSVLGFAVLLWWWPQIRQGRRQWLWGLPPFFVLWANLHGGFTAGLFLLGLLLLSSLLLRVTVDRWPAVAAWLDEPILSWERWLHLSLIVLVAALVTLLNPYGWRLHAEIYDSLTDRFMVDTLREWQPVSLQGWAGRAYGWYLAGLAVLVIGWYRRIEPVRWMLVLVMLALSLRHWRNVTLFLIVSLPLAAELLPLVTASLRRWAPILTRQPNIALGLVTLTVGGTLSSLGTDHLIHVWRSGTATEASFEETEYPIEAVRWIRHHRSELGSRVYNDYGHGGFLLWQLPGERIFIDGRMPAWHLGDRWIFRDYVELNREEAPTLVLLDRYEVDWAITQRGGPVARALESQRGWRTLYTDEKVVILRRPA